MGGGIGCVRILLFVHTGGSWFGMVGSWIARVSMPQVRRLTLVAGGLIFWLLMLVVIFLGFVVGGTRLF